VLGEEGVKLIDGKVEEILLPEETVGGSGDDEVLAGNSEGAAVLPELSGVRTWVVELAREEENRWILALQSWMCAGKTALSDSR
jgi:hypothetical protein